MMLNNRVKYHRLMAWLWGICGVLACGNIYLSYAAGREIFPWCFIALSDVILSSLNYKQWKEAEKNDN